MAHSSQKHTEQEILGKVVEPTQGDSSLEREIVSWVRGRWEPLADLDE